MAKEKILIETSVFVWECSCGQRFAILNMFGTDSWGILGEYNQTTILSELWEKINA